MAGTKTISSGNIFSTEFRVKYLSEIETDQERIVFELSTTSTERQDIRSVTMPDGTHGVKRLNAIHIYNKLTGKKIKSINLTYDYFACNLTYEGVKNTVTDYLTKRLKLLSVQEVNYELDGTPKAKPPYSFTYNEAISLPRKDAYARDHWGNFNGQANQSLLPSLISDVLGGVFNVYRYMGDFTPDFVITDLKNEGTANKGMSEIHAKAAILTQVHYPTGGYVVFDYEANRYKNYRTFSAQEIASGEGHNNYDFDDFNTSLSDPVGGYIHPDAEGRVTIDDVYGGFSKVGSNVTNADMAGVNVTLWKENQAGTKTVVKIWTLETNSSTGEVTGWQFGPEYLEYVGPLTDKYYFEAYLPNTPALTPQGGSLVPLATASCHYSLRDPATLSKESIGGGLRIKSVKTYSAPSILAGETQYRYLGNDGSTSGKLMSPPRNYSYIRYMFDYRQYVDLYQLGSYSYVPLSSDAQGSVVGYDRVEVSTVSGQNNLGKTVSYFRNKPAELFISNSFGQFTSAVPNIPHFDNGLIDSVEYYSATGMLLKKTLTTYTTIKDESFFNNVILFDLQYGTVVTDNYCWGNCEDPGAIYTNEVKDNLFRTSTQAKWYMMGRDEIDSYKKWTAVYFPTRIRWIVPNTTKDITYNNGTVALSTVATSSYNTYGQVVQNQMTNSKGEIALSEAKYPIDITNPDATVQAMISKKLFYLPLEQTESLKPAGSSTFQELSKSQNNYIVNSNGNIKLLNVKKSFRGASLFDAVNNVKYDHKDNILQYEKNGVTTSYQWGYSQSYPVAKIDNATTSIQVTNVISPKTINVLKTSGTQEAYTTGFTVGASGVTTLGITFSGAPNTNETATISCHILAKNGLLDGYDNTVFLCLGAGTLANSCSSNGQSITLNLSPGDYTISALMTFENGVSVGKGRTITISYPDVSVNFTGSEYHYQNYEDSGTDGAAHTGKKYSTSPSVSWTRPNTRNYVISYWYRQSGVWKYSGEIAYTGSSYTMTGGDAYDDVRIHPKDAQMTTYTFEPSVGMTSQTDATGMTTYFEFDVFGRFKLARDANNNILKNYVYNYKLTPTNN
jgi:hypothetical protein